MKTTKVAGLVLGLLVISCASSQPAVKSVPAQVPVQRIEKNVAYIEVTPSKEVTRIFRRLIASPDISPKYRNFLVGYISSRVSGTAFSVHSDSNETWLATNQHVVEWGDEVMLSFDKEERSRFVKGKIIAVDEEADLALVSIPKEHSVFKMANAVRNGDKVRALGFPRGETFQITEGVVMQKCFNPRVFGMSFYEDCLITHSATLNGGSSGGPLVSESGEVVGVNKASRVSMDNNYYAIPSKSLIELIVLAKSRVGKERDKEWRKNDLKETCSKLIIELGSRTPELSRVTKTIAYKMIADQGMEWYEKWEHPVKRYFFADDPVLAMRISIFFGMHNLIRQAGGGDPENVCDHFNPGDSILGKKEVRIELKLRENFHPETWWKYEQGEWRLARFDFDMPQHKDLVSPSSLEEESGGEADGKE